MRDSISRKMEEFWEKSYVGLQIHANEGPGRDLTPIVQRLKRHGAVSVLDLGSGIGRWSLALARSGFRVTALDISAEAIRKLEMRARSEGLAVETRVGSAEELDRSLRFDAVICNSLLDHLPLRQAARVARNIRAVLNPEGIAYLAFDGWEDDRSADYEVLGDGTRRYLAGKREGMLWRFYTDPEILDLCRDLTVLQLTRRDGGSREVWVLKRSPARVSLTKALSRPPTGTGSAARNRLSCKEAR